MIKKELLEQSQNSELLSLLLEHELGRKVIISRFHNLKEGDGNNLFYVITSDQSRFLVNIMGRRARDNALLYWIENINLLGLVADCYYERDVVVVNFNRGENYQNEYVSFHYEYGNSYPLIRVFSKESYPGYLAHLNHKYKKYNLNIPEDLRFSN